jgi:uncharacterized repeat protein (TIGR01451 family)
MRHTKTGRDVENNLFTKKENTMSTRTTTIIVGLLLCLGLALAAPHAAMAAGTPACTPIGNTATVNYQVGGFSQAAVASSVTFTVGNKINHTVTVNDALNAVAVVSNQTGAVLTFTITNNGNANQTYLLSYANLSGVTTSVFSGNNTVTDTFDPASAATSVGTTGVVSAGTSTIVTIIATMPAGLTDNTYAALSLTATARKIDGTAETNNVVSTITSTLGSCSADVVFGDPAGTDDAANDGKASARDAYHVVLTNLTVAKTMVVYSDPTNGTTNPRAIPGAIAEYVVVITNTGGSTATAVTITDTLAGTLTPVSGIAWTSKTAGGGAGCSGKAREAITGVNGGAWNCLNGVANGGDSSWAGQLLTATVNNLVSGGTATIVYQATIQ